MHMHNMHTHTHTHVYIYVSHVILSFTLSYEIIRTHAHPFYFIHEYNLFVCIKFNNTKQGNNQYSTKCINFWHKCSIIRCNKETHHSKTL